MQTHIIHHSSRPTSGPGSRSASPNPWLTVNLRPKPAPTCSPLPTSYTIYVDGGWDSTDTDFYSAFQEQRDPINRRGSADIAIVPTGTDWKQQGTIVITLNNGAQVGSQPAHMELAAIVVGLALRRWYLPHNKGT